MTVDIGAGPYKVPYRARPMEFEVDGARYVHERAIATQQTGFSLVAQMNRDYPEAMKGILWFGCDDANTCVYVPVFCSVTRIPHGFQPGNGDLYNISWDSSFWVNNFVANQAYYRYSQMIPDIRKVQGSIEDRLAADTDSLRTSIASLPTQQAAEILNDYTIAATDRYIREYRNLGEYLLVKYLDFNVKKEEKDGRFSRTPDGMPATPDFPGYDDPRYFKSIVDETGDKLRVHDIKPTGH